MNWQIFPFYFYPVYDYNCNYYINQQNSSQKKPIIESSQKQLLVSSAPTIQNQEKIRLTEKDLQNQTYDVNKKPWTEQQDQQLIFLYQKNKLNWQQIAAILPNRNKKMCYSRYRRLQCGTKIKWTNQDNQKLRQLVSLYGQDWKLIANSFQHHNIKQIREHYKNYLRPDITSSNWSLDDDLQLISLINKYGKNWKIIQNQMSHRSINQVKNRYYGKLKKLNAQLYGNHKKQY